MTKDDWRAENAINQMRMLRHDFMNYLQVIYGYIQINRPQEAINYIKLINQKMLIFSRISNLEAPEFTLLMQDLLFHIYKYNCDIDFYTNLEYISFDNMLKNIDSIQTAFDRIKHFLSEQFKEYDYNLLHMNTTSENYNLNLLITNNEECKGSIFEQNRDMVLIDETNEYLIEFFKKGENFLISLNLKLAGDDIVR